MTPRATTELKRAQGQQNVLCDPLCPLWLSLYLRGEEVRLVSSAAVAVSTAMSTMPAAMPAAAIASPTPPPAATTAASATVSTAIPALRTSSALERWVAIEIRFTLGFVGEISAAFDHHRSRRCSLTFRSRNRRSYPAFRAASASLRLHLGALLLQNRLAR